MSAEPLSRDEIVDSLYAAIDDVNHARPGETSLEKSPDAPLYGSASALDSLGLVNFVVAAEQRIQERSGKSIVLADDRALAREPSPFASVGALADYVEVLLREME
jgi:acyl carrier protein